MTVPRNAAPAAAVLFALPGGIAIAATSGSSNQISACAKKRGGLRLAKTCRANERKVVWGKTGPKGAKGAAGATGATGATGTGPTGTKAPTACSAHLRAPAGQTFYAEDLGSTTFLCPSAAFSRARRASLHRAQ